MPRNVFLLNNFAMHAMSRLFLLWMSTTLALWIVDALFESLSFATLHSLVLSGFLLALANLTLKPLLVLVTLPLTLLSFGLMLPVINGLVLLGVAQIVPGFEIAGFWMGVLCALAVSFVGLLIGLATGQSAARGRVQVGRFTVDAGRSQPPFGRDGAQDPNTIDGEFRDTSAEKPREIRRLDGKSDD